MIGMKANPCIYYLASCYELSYKWSRIDTNEGNLCKRPDEDKILEIRVKGTTSRT
jgi:hypothetical protein